MKVFPSVDLPQKIQSQYIYFDNDFLSQLFTNENTLRESLLILQGGFFLVDPLTKFEFLRDTFLPQQYQTKIKFLSSEIFYPALDHADLQIHLQENAIILSRIYKHQSHKTTCSLVDIYLAARLMYQKTPLLITGNKKDFPHGIFDTVGVFNIEQVGDDSMRVFSIIQFNENKFNTCYQRLNNLA